MNVFGDLEDLEQVFDINDEFNKTRIFGSGSCSALIKILPNNEDLYVAHDTWNSYQSMLRMLKKYDFAYHWTKGPKVGRVSSRFEYSQVPNKRVYSFIQFS